jgi:hypothetical protein
MASLPIPPKVAVGALRDRINKVYDDIEFRQDVKNRYAALAGMCC